MSDFLIQQMVRQLEVDAAHSGCPMPLGLVVEVEMAASTTEPALQKTRDHLLKRYQEYGFVHLPVKYHEPASVRSAPQINSLLIFKKTRNPCTFVCCLCAKREFQ